MKARAWQSVAGLWLTLNTEDDCIGVLHVGFADAEDGFFSVWCHAGCHRLRKTNILVY